MCTHFPLHSACPNSMNINFETGLVTECGIKVLGEKDGYKMQWLAINESTPTEDTGPLRAFLGKYYAYAEASKIKKDDKGRYC